MKIRRAGALSLGSLTLSLILGAGCSSVCDKAQDLCGGEGGDFSGKECTGPLRKVAECLVDLQICSKLALSTCVASSELPGDDGGVGPTADGGTTVTQVTPHYFPQSVEKDVDILFVIDNSSSMQEEQVSLAENFPKLIEALRSDRLGADGTGRPCNASDRSGCAIPNVHIGVISSDEGAGNYTTVPSCEAVGGDKGKLQNTPRVAGCTPPRDPFISYIDGTTNAPGGNDPISAVKEAFACIARLGTDGCNFEQQLEAARRALDPQANVNPGFVRPDAFLATVFITDEDDCSARNPQLYDPTQSALTDPLGPLTSFRCFEFGITCDVNGRTALGERKDCRPSGDWLWDIESRYVDFFRGLKPPGRVVVAAIAGPTDRVTVGQDAEKPVLRQSCASTAGVAVPAIRIKALVDAFAPDSQFSSICTADFGPALSALGQKILSSLGSQCLSGPLLTAGGSLACQQGDRFGPSATCPESCLHQAECEVLEVVGQGTASERTVPIPKCPVERWYPADWRRERDCGDTCPCWRLVKKDERDCAPEVDGSPYALDILRQGEAAKGTVAEVRCVTAPQPWGSAALEAVPACR